MKTKNRILLRRFVGISAVLFSTVFMAQATAVGKEGETSNKSSLTQRQMDQNAALLTNYQQAKIAIKFEGTISDFAQRLADKLQVGYLAYQFSPDEEIVLEQADSQNIAHLLQQVNPQLESQQLGLAVINQRVFLTLTDKAVNVTHLWVPEKKSYFGNPVFDAQGGVSAPDNAIPSVPKQLEPIEQTSSTQSADSTQERGIISTEVAADEASTKPDVSEAKDTGSAAGEDTPFDAQEISESAIPVSNLSPEQRAKEQKGIEDILKVSQDAKLIAQYTRRAQPIYVVPDKKALRLEAIKSTKISTFLVFEQGVDVNQYEFDGRFQKIAKLDNLVAILHRQQQPPAVITVITPDKQKQLITKTR
ncbi:hypothetical protein [Conservatibacter flavescens]|uniref:Uncharacterized protein n=1 Tax=Conservatibacter flavescens TaxID=28161 RepID=A0A2M8S4A0_9PAST|nr:hypothetical protein [Conservatibacter flavescens]PJG85918.1 hypothetical protein CVP05_04065 [Conservatibacter flavescens]